MENQQVSELLATLAGMEALAGDVIDRVTIIRAEIEQTFLEIEQTNERRATT